MNSTLSFVARVLRWMAIIAPVAVFSVCQDTTGTPGSTNHFYSVQLSTGRIISDTFVGTRLQGATTIASKGAAGWSLVGVADFGPKGLKGMVYSSDSSGGLAVIFYSGAGGAELLGSQALATPGEGWSAKAVADLNGDGALDVIFVNKATGQVDVCFYGGPAGTTLLGRETISPLSATGWNVVGVADLNADGRPDLILQNPSTSQVLANYLGGPKGTTVTGTEELVGDFAGWTAAGMQDINGDGHPDLILFNDAGQSKVRYFGGSLGATSLGESYLDGMSSPGSKTVVPSGAAHEFQPLAKTASVLIFDGTGTSTTDVKAVESVVSAAGLAYNTVNSSQLDGMTQSQLAGYKLFIVPGGNSITIGNNLSPRATSTVRGAVQQNGLSYLGLCAGGFFGGFSKYNGLDLTSGVWFSFYPDYYKGIHKEVVRVSISGQSALDIYWQDGPELSGWGKVIGKFPNGQPAIVEGTWGNGFLILSGVHPEAPASWRTGMNFKTPLDVDLAYAATLVEAALNRTMLPHY